jgi:hypothetical protein
VLAFLIGAGLLLGAVVLAAIGVWIWVAIQATRRDT